jgi:hypothetical protein
MQSNIPEISSAGENDKSYETVAFTLPLPVNKTEVYGVGSSILDIHSIILIFSCNYLGRVAQSV